MKRELICILLILVLFSQAAFASNLTTEENILPEDNIKIAIIDTGISTRAIAPEQIEQGYNYLNGSTDTEDKIGHGTAVAGIIAGSSSANVKGIAPMAKLVPLVYQTRDEYGKVQKGNQAMIAVAIRDAVDLYGCRIINLSIGTTVDSKLLREAVDYAEEKNAVVISSVGNRTLEGQGCLYYPAAYPTVIGVGSVNKRGRISDFSQRNESVMLVAQGEKIWTASKEGKPLLTNGTSYAAAYVSGVAAALLSAHPELTAAEVRHILCGSATDIQTVGYDIDSGWGILK